MGRCRAWAAWLLLATAITASAPQAWAADYFVSNEAELRQAIIDANADGDPSATITLTSNISVADPTAFPAVTKPVTIDTGAFTLQGADVASGSGDGTPLSFLGGSLIISGTARGGNADTNPNTGAAGAGAIGIVLDSGSLDNEGAITGGAGGGDFAPGSGGVGGAGVNLTNSSFANDGTITGGQGGDVAGSTATANTVSGVGGTGVVMDGGSLNNQGSIIGGDAGDNLVPGAIDNAFGAVGGVGAFLTGGTHTSSGTITGGEGGLGENAGGPGGGVGGVGLALAGNATFTNSGAITGGTGGIEPFRLRGSAGGAAVSIANSTLINTGTITGGTGGDTTTAGVGGVGILGTGGATIVNAATISGGIRPSDLALNNAIQFSNGNNMLELQAGFVINGNVVAGAGDTFALGGAADSSFNVALIGPAAQYRNFGSYQKTGASTWTLTGTTTTTTSWQLLGGTLSVSSNANLGAAAGTLTFNGGILQVTGTSFTSTPRTINWGAIGGGFDIADPTNTFTVSQTLAGGGPLAKLGAGTLVFTGNNTYVGGTTVSAGTLQLGNGGTSGSIAGNVLDNGVLTFNRSNTLTLDGLISGTGAVNQIGTGTTALTGNNTYAGLTTISAGTLQLGDGGTSGSIAGNILNNSVLAFNRSDTFTVPGAISGSGAVEQNGAGTTVLTADNTYAGGTTISAGTLQLGNGGATGSFLGDVVADGTLAFNRSDALTFGGVISGAGGIRQIGSGLTNLTADSSSFTGTTSVEDGTLAVNGSLCGDVNVLSGARLQGTGILCDANNFAGGTVAPGNSIGAITVTGAYVGTGGTLEIETVLGGDSSPTDQLILAGAGASASGSTFVQVINLGGAGALTGGFGIPIVVAQGGAVTTASAFSLAGPVAAGPFQYLLFRGPESGGTADEQNTWFLRSFLQEAAEPGIPLYRPETSMYAALPGEARALGLMTLGTFHERNGDQGLARGAGGSERAWGRIFGAHLEQASPGAADASFSGYLAGVQLGIDALHFRGNDGAEDVAGLFFALPQARGDVNGFAVGVVDAYAGNSQLTGPGYGAYFTHIGPGNWYVDAVAMASFYEAIGTSTNNAAIDVNASGIIASLEGGFPLPLGGGLTLEPQAQLVYQYLDFDQARDIFSSVDIEAADVLTGRLGARLAGVFGTGPDAWRPYLKANLWYDWGGTDRAIYAGVNELSSEQDVTAFEAGGGLVVQLTDGVGLWGDAAYTTDVNGSDLEIVEGNAGVKVSW